MPTINTVQNGQPAVQNQQVQGANQTTAPQVLQNAKPKAATVCRILAGIFSFGISEGVFAICKHIEAKAAASQARGAGEALPVGEPSVMQQNSALSEQFKKDTLPPALKAAVSEAFSELRVKYGEKAFPECSTVQDLLAKAAENRVLSAKSIINDVAAAMRNFETEISPQDLKNCIIEKARPSLAASAAHAFIREKSPTISSDYESVVFNALLKSAGFSAQLAACNNAEEVKNCLLNQPNFNDTLEYYTGYSECEEKAIQHITAELAKVTGKSQQEIQAQLNVTEAKNKFSYASEDTREIKDVKERLEQLKTKFHEAAENFIKTKTELYTSIAPLAVSEGLKEQLRTDVLSESTLKKGYVFSRAEQAVNQVNVSSLIRVLKEGDSVSDLDLLGMFNAVSVQLSDAITKLYTKAELADLGGDGNAITMSTACQILLDKNPELVELLKSNPAKLDRLLNVLFDQRVAADEQLVSENGLGSEAARLNVSALYGSSFILNTVKEIIRTNSSVVSSLQTGTGEERFAQIMHDTLAEINADYGVNVGASLKDLSELPFGKDVINTIENRINSQNQYLSSAQFAEIMRFALNEHAANLAAKTAISERCAELGLNTERIADMLASLKKLYPALQESINKADSKEMIQALFLSCDKYENILRRESDIAKYSVQITKDTHARLAVLLNIDAADIKKTMRLDDLENDFHMLANKIHNEGDASEDGSAVGISERFQSAAERFVQSKMKLYTFVNELDISDELKTLWRNEININTSLKDSVLLQGSYDIAQRMDGSGLARALRDGLNQSELMGLVKSLSAQIDVYAHQVFTQEQFDKMGSDETALISYLARNVFWDKNGDLKAIIKNNSEVMHALVTSLDNEILSLYRQISKINDITSKEYREINDAFAFANNAQELIGDVLDEE